MIVNAVCGSISVATGTAWYVEPFQQMGGLGAFSVPQGMSRSVMDSGDFPNILASLLIT